jgi:hypothetical protein
MRIMECDAAYLQQFPDVSEEHAASICLLDLLLDHEDGGTVFPKPIPHPKSGLTVKKNSAL